MQIEPAAGAGTVIGGQRRFEHEHAGIRPHGTAHIGENANAIRIVVVVHEVADQIGIAPFGCRIRKHVAGDEGHAGQRSALPALGGGDGLRHIEQRRAPVRVGGKHGGQERTVAAADIDDVIECREVVGGNDRGRLRSVHLEHHAIEAPGFVRMVGEPSEERPTLERLEGGAVAGERVIEMHPHVGEVVVEEDRRGPGAVRRVRTEQAPERRQREAPARRLGHDPDGRERAQQPVDAIRNETARRGDGGVVHGAVLHHVRQAQPRERSHRPGHPQAAQQLQHLLVQQRRIDVGRFTTLAVHDPVPQNTSTAPTPSRWGVPRIDEFGARS